MIDTLPLFVFISLERKDKRSQKVAGTYLKTTSEVKRPDKQRSGESMWWGIGEAFFKTTSEAKCPDKPVTFFPQNSIDIEWIFESPQRPSPSDFLYLK